MTDSELATFLDNFYWRHTTSETGWHNHSKRLDGTLRSPRTDDDAINSGVLAVRGWVKDGGGPKTADDVRLRSCERGLLARDGTLLFAVHGIERTVTPTPPNIELDFVDLYDGHAVQAKQLPRPLSQWEDKVRPDIDAAARILKAFGVQRVHVAGSMRLPMWFAVGRALPRVGKSILSVEQVGGEWSTGVEPEPVVPRELNRSSVSAGSDVAIALGCRLTPTPQVMNFLTASGLPVDRLVVLGPPGALSHTSVPSGAWALGWTQAARDLIRGEAAAAGASRVRGFMLCPSGIALMLGHHWNMLPDTTLYEFVGQTYEPTISALALGVWGRRAPHAPDRPRSQQSTPCVGRGQYRSATLGHCCPNFRQAWNHALADHLAAAACTARTRRHPAPPAHLAVPCASSRPTRGGCGWRPPLPLRAFQPSPALHMACFRRSSVVDRFLEPVVGYDRDDGPSRAPQGSIHHRGLSVAGRSRWRHTHDRRLGETPDPHRWRPWSRPAAAFGGAERLAQSAHLSNGGPGEPDGDPWS